MSYQHVTITALALVALAACRSDRDRSDDSDYRPTSSSSSTTTASQNRDRTTGSSRIEASAGRSGQVSIEDRNFVAEAASGGRFEVESSQLALDKCDDKELQRFAQMMIDDHSKANRELEQLASRKNIPIAPAMASKHAMMMDRLRGMNGKELDREYRRVQTDAHRETIQLFERAAREVTDQDIRAFAQKTLPTLRAHLAHIEEQKPSDAR